MIIDLHELLLLKENQNITKSAKANLHVFKPVFREAKATTRRKTLMQWGYLFLLYMVNNAMTRRITFPCIIVLLTAIPITSKFFRTTRTTAQISTPETPQHELIKL